MKKFLSILFISFTLISLTSCNQSTSDIEISCYEIEQAYLKAGYYVFHREHKNEYDSCYMIMKKSEKENDAIYFNIYDTVEEAQKIQEDEEWNVLLWFYGVLNNEFRWLKSKCYNNIQYDYFDSSLVKPFIELIESKNRKNI